MPLFLSLALAAQNVTLTQDPIEAPKICAVALSLVQRDKPALFRAATFSYLISTSVAANPADGPFFNQLNALGTKRAAYPTLTLAEAEAYAPQCDKRYPQARREGAVKLPTDPLARDATCLFSLSTMGGASGGMADGDPALTKRYNDAAGRFSTRFDATIAQRNLSDDAAMALATKLVIDGLEIGNAYVVSEACLKLPQP